MKTQLLVCALGLAIFMEGMFYAVCAPKLPGLFLYMAEQRPQVLRAGGFVAMLAGMAVIALGTAT